MSRLALAVESESDVLSLHAGNYIFSRDHEAEIVAFVGRRVVFFRPGGFGVVRYIAMARIAAIEAVAGTRATLRAKLVAVEAIGPVSLDGTERAVVSLDDASFTAILQAAVAAQREAPVEAGLRESAAVAAPYDHGPPGMEIYHQLHAQVLRNFGFRCAVTHQQFSEAAVLQQKLLVIPIRTLEDGGQLHVTNFMPLCTKAAAAFHDGDLAIGSRFEIWAALDRVEPALVRKMPGLLHLPKDERDWPSQASLAWHRDHVFSLRA
ncbi:MAG TPA: hypothetical protein VGO70_01570 [Arsenicitalea sp.]|jgi:hypothetical protein|nr:hypothetical protein [Arsenicitalea sp.]